MNQSLQEITPILAYRLVNQQLVNPQQDSTPQAVVRRLGAMQAQDYAMAKWAVGVRLADSTDALIEDALNRGTIIRTHVLRPTWHLVAADDIRWMLHLTAPHVNRLASTQYRQLELDDTLFVRTNALIARMLEGGHHLTRDEIMTNLKAANIQTNALRATHIMFRAELDQVVCNGIRRGKQFTYALFDELVPPGKSIDRSDALAALTLRYFTGHGPATIQDFAWWSGLTHREIRQGLEAQTTTLIRETIGAKTYWLSADQPTVAPPNDTVHLLPAFDEWVVGYADRSDCLPALLAQQAILSNGIFKPTVAVNGRLIGTWKRTIGKQALTLEMSFPGEYPPSEERLRVAAERYGVFVGLPLQNYPR